MSTASNSYNLETGQGGLVGSCATVLPWESQAAFEDGGSFVPPCSGTGPVLGCTDPAALNYNALATQDNGSCTYGTPLTWFNLKALWRTQKPAKLVAQNLTPVPPLPNPTVPGQFCYPYAHKMCLLFAEVVDGAITRTFSRFPGGVVSAPAQVSVLAHVVSGVSYYAIQFYGTRTPTRFVTPPGSRPFASSSTNFAIYPVTVPM